MKIKIGFLIFSIGAIIPIFYLSICIYFNKNLYSSFQIVNDIYYGFLQGRSLDQKVYLASTYAITPFFLSLFLLVQGKNSKKYGFATWAKLKDIEKIGFSLKGGIPIANFNGKTIYIKDPRSVFIMATPGAGKTAGIAIPILLTFKYSLIVTDIKGELYKLTSKFREMVLKNKIYCFSPYDKKNNTFKFNPFSKKIIKNFTFNERLRLVKEFSNVLFVKDKNADSHWIESAKDLFVFFAMYDITKYNESYLYELGRYPKKAAAELLNDDYMQQLEEAEEEGIIIDEMNLFLKQAAEDTELDPLVRDMARAASRINRKEFQSIVTTYTRTLNVFTDYDVAEATNDMSITYEALRKENITIYLKMKEKDIPTLAPLIRIFIEAVLQNLMDEENSNPHECVPIIADEIIRFGKLEKLIEFPALSRSYNMPLYFIGQNEAQIKKYYSQDDLDIISGTCAYNIYFAVNNEKEAERISKSIGTFTRTKESESTQFNKATGSKSKSDEGYSLVTAQDLLNLKKDEMIITVYGYKARPIKAKINFYFENKKMQKLIKKYTLKETS
ncbi:type IV secretory system conjugative DNA transfer family protein [Sulfurospirillum arcachonense]|uniref:type IV secretory system conjugative DNA transfer family protein n=1 Tax=Sulfurospirillum arcachonense TaxID=57666 RepID=UPI00046A284B|nr:type IV secretory system conjugative DNA transfer family protein [Sulfurospirillum arcachonense]